MKSTVFNDQQLTENSYSKIRTQEQLSSVINNMYYVGKIGKVSFDFNIDWLWNKNNEYSKTQENCQEIGKEESSIFVDSKQDKE